MEPVRQWFDRLQRARRNDNNVQVAAGAASGELLLYETPDTGLSTSVPEIADRHENERGYARSENTDDRLIHLYSACRAFGFPSWHEGFGLPALEAMQCGAPAIGANASSVPEVIGRADALFDPFDVNSICRRMAQVLQDSSFRSQHIRVLTWKDSSASLLSAVRYARSPSGHWLFDQIRLLYQDVRDATLDLGDACAMADALAKRPIDAGQTGAQELR